MFLAYLPALFLAFSGLAVGYILWYRDSRQDDFTRRKLISQNMEMKQALTTAKTSYAALDERFTRQRGQLGVLQQLCDDWSANREQAEKERAVLDVQLNERTRQIEDLSSELQAAREKSIKLEDTVHSLTQTQLEKISSIESQWSQKTSLAETSLVQSQAEVKSLAGDRDRQLEKLHKAESRIAELESELRSNASMLENAKQNVSLETALKHSKELLKKSEGQCAAERSEKETVREQLEVAKANSAKLQEQIDEFQLCRADMETYKQKAEALVLSLSNANGQLDKVLAQRDSALDSYSSLQTTSNGLQARLENQEASIHRLRKCQDDALENLKHELKVRSQMEAKYDSRLSELREKLEKQNAEHQKQLAEAKNASGRMKQDFDTEVEMLHEVAEKEVLDLKKQLEGANRTIATFKANQAQERNRLKEFEELSTSLQTSSTDYQQQVVKLDAQREQLAIDLETARQQLKSQLKQDSETIGLLQGERKDLRTEVERLHEKIADLQEALVKAERSHQQIAEDNGLLEQTKTRAANLEKELIRKETALKHLLAESNELARLRDEHASSLRRQAELQARLDSMMADHLTDQTLREQIRDQEKIIQSLRNEIEDLEHQRPSEPDPAIISFTQAIKQRNESIFDPDYGGRVRHDAARGIVFTEAPDSRDDLKRISGIATVLEGRLNDFGVYTFKQIMNWNPEEVEEFSRLLAFRDRIERDDWQGQARFFYSQKQAGAAPAA
jgi:predicted flap endonuclease-1-like 5' DNA nuclease/acylphosphatase